MYRGQIEQDQSPKTSFTTKHLVWIMFETVGEGEEGGKGGGERSAEEWKLSYVIVRDSSVMQPYGER